MKTGGGGVGGALAVGVVGADGAARGLVGEMYVIIVHRFIHRGHQIHQKS